MKGKVGGGVGKCVGVYGKVRGNMGKCWGKVFWGVEVGGGVGKCWVRCGQVLGEVWESVLECGGRRRCRGVWRSVGGGVRKCIGMWRR